MVHEQGNFQSPEQYAHEILARTEQVVNNAKEILGLETLPSPGEVRANDPGLGLTAEQETVLRSCAAELGFGRSSDKTLSEQGLVGAAVIIEGGQPHKIAAELGLLHDDQAAQPRMIVMSASPYRKITSPAEQASAQNLGIEPKQDNYSEYDVAEAAARALTGFESQEEVDLPYGYDIQNGHALVERQTGQLRQIGTLNGTPVVLFRVDRELYEEDGATKYRNQPGVSDIMRIVGSVTGESEGCEGSPVVCVTSATYEASRSVDAAIAGLDLPGQTVGVATYGTERLAHVRGESTPAPGPINQLPAELGKTEKELGRLRAQLDQKM